MHIFAVTLLVALAPLSALGYSSDCDQTYPCSFFFNKNGKSTKLDFSNLRVLLRSHSSKRGHRSACLFDGGVLVLIYRLLSALFPSGA